MRKEIIQLKFKNDDILSIEFNLKTMFNLIRICFFVVVIYAFVIKLDKFEVYH